MKVLIADNFPNQYVEKIKSHVKEVIFEPKLKENDLQNHIKGIDILVVRSTVVNAECIEKSDRLSLIIRAGAGVNTIDIKSANKKGIYITNCPGKNSIAVAELAMGLICAIDRRIPDNVIDFRNGKWNKALYSKADGLAGKTLGVVGTGQIGSELIKRAKAFGLNIIAWSRSLTDKKAEEIEIERAASLEELFSSSDIISVHLAQTAETKKIISKELISKLKKGAYFINTARAGVVDETALIEAAKSGNIFLGLDVFNNEPEGKEGELSTPIRELPNVYLTHHIGASTEQAQNAVAEETCNIIADYVNAGVIRNWVNRIKQSPAKYQLVVRHYDKPGVLARVLRLLSEEKINAQEMENVIFDDALTACCTIKLDSQPTEKTIKEIESAKEEIINLTLIEL
ncbi:MAG: phosphoglycerate dehydrogenase [Ignavibacteria bacterium GWB2_36_8]|nr:MAG: phosphoglycerate dehydrogenase [Ignavibacteria bacterium GWB2_36_8]OGU53193.1 MAG: phosphoglycerate dehydrogenase [Ignavibacteria bacterium GWC2_36_12]